MADDDDARTLVERAEREPVTGHRLAPVRAAIDAAAQALDRAAVPELRARLLLRLATAKLVENDLEGADQALEAVGRHVPDDTVLRFLAGIRACRVAIRRGPEPRRLAQETLLAAAARLDHFVGRSSAAAPPDRPLDHFVGRSSAAAPPDRPLDTGAPRWAEVTTEVALAIAELALHDDPPDPSAFEPIAAIVDEPSVAPEVAFAGQQLVAGFALSIADVDRAVRALRAAVAIARDLGSPADEIETRLALASALVAGGAPLGMEEATRHVQIARDRALEHGLAELHEAALLAQAGVLSNAGKTAGAIDRVLELARAAVAKQDIPQYVAAVSIMAELYAKSGDHVSAFRTIAEAHHALAHATGQDAAPLFRPMLARLRDRVGEERLLKIASEVDHANRLADQIALQNSKDPA